MTNSRVSARRVTAAARGRASRTSRRVRYRLLKQVLGRARPGDWQRGHLLMGHALEASPPWQFHDERWSHIVHRWALRSGLAKGEPIDLADHPQPLSDDVAIGPQGDISIRALAETSDEWVYLYVDPKANRWENYVWSLTVQCQTRFKELQLGFRYVDFYNRYRYRFQAGRLSFDMVLNGEFVTNLSSCRLELVPGRAYEIEIRVLGQLFQCWVDGRLRSQDYDRSNRLPCGPIALILWEDDGCTDIVAQISTNTVQSLRRRQEVPTVSPSSPG